MQDKATKKSKLVYDLILIGSILLLALSAFLFIRGGAAVGAFAEVWVDGELVLTVSLSDDGEYPIGEGNLLVISDGEAHMKDADCPDKLCVHQGRISRTGERIVCLPNRVIVEIVGNGEEVLGV